MASPSPCRPDFGVLKQCKTLGGEDRVSALPNELLLDILARLTLKEAIATDVLSRRWKNLWARVPNLDFGSCLYALRGMDEGPYVQMVDKVLGLYSGSKLHKLRIVYPLPRDLGCHIDEWISFAFAKGVDVFELDLTKIFCHGDPQNYYVPAHVLQKEKTMQLKRCISVSATPLITEKRFDSLKELRLISVNLSDEVFELILSNCSSLEVFLLRNSYGLRIARNTAPHLKLKSFEVDFCQDLEILELFAPNLVSFKYLGWERSICFKDSRKLSSLLLLSINRFDPHTTLVSLPPKEFFRQFFSYLPMLESLSVTAHLIDEVGDASTELPVFTNLKQLVCDVSSTSPVQLGYYAAAAIVKVAPNLQQLELNLPGVYSFGPKLKLPSIAPHQKLKELKVSGFRGHWDTMEFVMLVVELAVSLQKIDFTVKTGGRMGTDLILLRGSKWYAFDAELCKKRVQSLRQRLPADAQLLYDDEGLVLY